MASFAAWIPAAISVVSSLFGGKGDTPAPAPAPAPKPEPVTPMPTPNDKAVQDAKKKSIAAITARQGRASTILTGEDTAGGGSGGSLGA